ncbi:MAG: hypothetical protein JXX28_02480 [Deltaproteobacteria bacterium]|nr:hypothetical protein [Deltaproteobacteria bacterium]
MGWWGLLLLACSAGSTVEPPSSQPDPATQPQGEVLLPSVEREAGPGTTPSSAEDEGPTPQAQVLLPGEAPRVVLSFTGIGQLHRGFFGSEAAIAELEAQLSACTSGDTPVMLRWSEEDRWGIITAQLDADRAACLPRWEGEDLELRELARVGAALAAYRDRVAGSFDYRISSFAIEVQVARGDRRCTFSARGEHPPDGRRFARCVRTPGGSFCGAGEDGVTRITGLSAEGRRWISTCTPSAGPE